jgi:hypothetical protein
MQYFISLIFRDGSNLWWCKEHRHFYNPIKQGYRRGALQPKRDSIPLDDFSLHQRAAEEWVIHNIPQDLRPVRLVAHVVERKKNARR